MKEIQRGRAALQLLYVYTLGVQVLCFSVGESTCGQRAIYHSLGLTGIPIINVNNNCSTGSTALFMAQQLVQGGKVCFIINVLQSLTCVGVLSASVSVYHIL